MSDCSHLEVQPQDITQKTQVKHNKLMIETLPQENQLMSDELLSYSSLPVLEIEVSACKTFVESIISSVLEKKKNGKKDKKLGRLSKHVVS